MSSPQIFFTPPSTKPYELPPAIGETGISANMFNYLLIFIFEDIFYETIRFAAAIGVIGISANMFSYLQLFICEVHSRIATDFNYGEVESTDRDQMSCAGLIDNQVFIQMFGFLKVPKRRSTHYFEFDDFWSDSGPNIFKGAKRLLPDIVAFQSDLYLCRVCGLPMLELPLVSCEILSIYMFLWRNSSSLYVNIFLFAKK